MSGSHPSEKKDSLPLEPIAPNHENASPSASIKRSPSPRPGKLGVSSSVHESTSPERRDKHPMTSSRLGFLDGSSSDNLPLSSTYSNLASDPGRSVGNGVDVTQLGPGQGSVPVTAGLLRSNHPADVNAGERPHAGAMDSDRESSSGWSPAWSSAFDPSSTQVSPVPPYATNGVHEQFDAHRKNGSGSWGPYSDPHANGGAVGLGMSMEEKNGGYSTFPLTGPGLAQPYNYPTMKEQPTRSWASFQDSAAYWLVLYFFFNLGLTLFNKIVLVSFPFPYTLTGLHALSGCAGCYVAPERGAFTPARLTSRENVILALFSVLYTINIAVSNISLQLVTVPFHQVVRASTPIFTILISTVILRTRFSLMKLVSLLPVVAGVGFATYGDYYFTAWGLILTLLGTFLAALKTVVTNLIQTGGGGRLKLHPLDLLMRMSPLAFIQCVIYGWYTGELERVRKYGATQMTRSKAIALLVNGVIACGLNIVSFTANKKAGALTMTVSANCKQVLTIALAVVLFDLHINFTNSIGILLTLLGGGWYGWVEFQEKQKKNAIRLSEKS